MKCGKYIVVYFWSIKNILFCSIRGIHQSKSLIAVRWAMQLQFYLICNGSGESIHILLILERLHRIVNENGRGRVQHNLQWTSVIRNGYFSHQACVLILLRSSFPRESHPTSLPPLSCSSIFTLFTSRITNKLPQPRK